VSFGKWFPKLQRIRVPLKIKALQSFETSGITPPRTQSQIPEDSNLPSKYFFPSHDLKIPAFKFSANVRQL
jgi:hypothetical protein